MGSIVDSIMQLVDNKLLDSRVKGYGPTETHPQLQMERTYCVVCSKPYGWVSQESSAWIALYSVIVICDECHTAMGEMPLPRADNDLHAQECSQRGK